MSGPLDVPLDALRRRRSAKWTTYPADVLPMHVAELDVPLAAPVAAALREAVDLGDTGYAGDVGDLLTAFAGFARRRWSWTVAPERVVTCADVAAGITETLRLLVAPGDAVVLMPPVYPPFWRWLSTVGARPVEVPLRDHPAGGELDLAGIEAALAAGARVVLLCHPHNPTGRVHPPGDLAALAELAARHEATVLSDEIHAPLTLPGHEFVPYLTVSAQAAATGLAFHSASKAWNVAGLKCALAVAAAPGPQALLDRLPHEIRWGAGHLGVIAATAAYDHGDPWLDDLRQGLAANVADLAALLPEALPAVAFTPPQAGYLAWLDCRGLGLGDAPAATLRERARVACVEGTNFGCCGAGFVRLNLGCSPQLLRTAVRRMAQGQPTTTR